MITVSELIEKLKQYDSDLLVVIQAYEGNYEYCTLVNQINNKSKNFIALIASCY